MKNKTQKEEIMLFLHIGEEDTPSSYNKPQTRMAKITYIHALNSVKMFDDSNYVELEFPNEDSIHISKSFIKRLAGMLDKLPKKED